MFVANEEALTDRRDCRGGKRGFYRFEEKLHEDDKRTENKRREEGFAFLILQKTRMISSAFLLPLFILL